MKRTIITLFLPGLLLCLLLSGCKVTNMKSEEKQPLEYTVVKQEDIPPAIGSLIESKKQEEFQITYQDGEYLYLLRGYGRQKTGGYSIQVEELSMFAESIFFRTCLVGPEKGEEPSLEPSYPYIVIKLEYRDAPVQFDG
ncbi:MAG: protease complex subunit PrcB family protein [Lachnospiraceae bacterium]|nr:protease complex subunit PrcB family protein [Lachnospiraceae bacterium]